MDIFNSCLTASREIELRKLRAAGNTGSQTMYQELVRVMPQNADSTFHTSTILLSLADNLENHLHLGPLLRKVFATHCDCFCGDRTNASCSHVMAFVISLFCPCLFRSTKRKEGRMGDIWRPSEHRPISSGPPANHHDPRTNLVFGAPPIVPRRSSNSRRFREAQFEGFVNNDREPDDARINNDVEIRDCRSDSNEVGE